MLLLLLSSIILNTLYIKPFFDVFIIFPFLKHLHLPIHFRVLRSFTFLTPCLPLPPIVTPFPCPKTRIFSLGAIIVASGNNSDICFAIAYNQARGAYCHRLLPSEEGRSAASHD